MKLELTLFQLRTLLFPGLTTELDEARSALVRAVLDWNEPIAIPLWLQAAIMDAEDKRRAEFARNYPHEQFTPLFYIQTHGEHRFLWPYETWRASRDARFSNLARAKAAITADVEELNKSRARTAYEAKVYDWATKLAARIVDEFFPHMKKSHLRMSFQKQIQLCGFDLTRFRAALDETFDETVIKTCWVNQPEEYERQGNPEGNQGTEEESTSARSDDREEPGGGDAPEGGQAEEAGAGAGEIERTVQ